MAGGNRKRTITAMIARAGARRSRTSNCLVNLGVERVVIEPTSELETGPNVARAHFTSAHCYGLAKRPWVACLPVATAVDIGTAAVTIANAQRPRSAADHPVVVATRVLCLKVMDERKGW